MDSAYYVTQNLACMLHLHPWHVVFDVFACTSLHHVFMCTLLHSELRDYSLGQIAFGVFRALFAITQLLCH